MSARFWWWLMRLAYRRWASTQAPNSTVPTGIPGMRDPGAKCDAFTPRPRALGDWSCPGDGHYLCVECAYHNREGEYAL